MQDATNRVTKSPIEDTTVPKSKEDEICWWADTDYEHLECPNLIHTKTHTIEDTTVPKSTVIGTTYHGHIITIQDLNS